MTSKIIDLLELPVYGDYQHQSAIMSAQCADHLASIGYKAVWIVVHESGRGYHCYSLETCREYGFPQGEIIYQTS